MVGSGRVILELTLALTLNCAKTIGILATTPSLHPVGRIGVFRLL